VFALREPGGFVVRCGPDLALPASSTPPPEAHARSVAAAFAGALQSVVCAHPDQWCLLHRVAALDEGRGAA
jgi:hypothetical protein